MPPGQRSLSTELGNIQPQRPQQLSLQFLASVSSEENVSSTFNPQTASKNHQARPETDVHMSKPQFMLTSDVQQPSPVRSSEGSDISDSSYGSFFHLSQEYGKHTSGDSMGTSISKARHRDRSYRSQRQKLHKRTNVVPRGASSEDVGSTPVSASRNSMVSRKPMLRKPQRAAWSNQPLPFTRQENSLVDEEVISPTSSQTYVDSIPLCSHAFEYPSSSRSEFLSTASLGESLAKDSGGSDKHLVSPSIEVTGVQPTETDEELAKLKHTRRTIPATSSSVKIKVDLSLRQLESSHELSGDQFSTSIRPLVEGSALQSPKVSHETQCFLILLTLQKWLDCIQF